MDVDIVPFETYGLISDFADEFDIETDEERYLAETCRYGDGNPSVIHNGPCVDDGCLETFLESHPESKPLIAVEMGW